MKKAGAEITIKKNAGFRVAFERQEGGMLVSDHFPARDEDAIGTEEEAWRYATAFANAGQKKGIVNVYVINGFDWRPVQNYRDRKLNIYPQ